MTTYRHPDHRRDLRVLPPPLDCPTCGAAMRCPACRSPRAMLAPPGLGYWATCRDCGFPIGAAA